MGNETITKFKWFWVWQDKAEENWLGEMSEKGYHLVSVGPPCVYTFRKGDPGNYAYRLDYRHFGKRDRQEYLELFADAGWEYLGEMVGWHYFRKEVKPGEVNEIFTDTESKIAKYKRVLTYIGFMYLILLGIFLQRVFTTPLYPWWGNVHFFILLVLTGLTYAILKLLLRIRELRKLSAGNI
jgi:hypothetical protein